MRGGPGDCGVLKEVLFMASCVNYNTRFPAENNNLISLFVLLTFNENYTLAFIMQIPRVSEKQRVDPSNIEKGSIQGNGLL